MNGPTVDLPIGSGPRNWTALETLAEVSRQIGTGEKHDPTGASGASGTPEPNRADRLELQEQYTLENPPVSYEQRVQREKKRTSGTNSPENYPNSEQQQIKKPVIVRTRHLPRLSITILK